MKYKRITKEDVYRIILSVNFDFLGRGPDCINIVNIASLLNTSRYQVKKYIDELKNEGLIELRHVLLDVEDFRLPYWGYRLTEKARNTDHYRECEKSEAKLIKVSFGI